jgi:hypothetical protein
MSLELRELTVELFTPCQLDGETRTPSRDYCTLGAGLLHGQSIHDAGVRDASASENSGEHRQLRRA